jgi:hypothetical protein
MYHSQALLRKLSMAGRRQNLCQIHGKQVLEIVLA